MLEANPRASRTVPFVSKATATQLAKAASRIMLGETIAELRADGTLRREVDGAYVTDASPTAVKEAVMPFNRFRTTEGRPVDTLLGPEMKSTGEVMGIDAMFGPAFAKSQLGASSWLPTTGRVFISAADRHKRNIVFPVKALATLGFEILATEGTAQTLRRNGLEVTEVRKYSQAPARTGRRPSWR